MKAIIEKMLECLLVFLPFLSKRCMRENCDRRLAVDGTAAV